MPSMPYEWETFSHRYRLCGPGRRDDGWRELTPAEARWVLRSQLSDPRLRYWLVAMGQGASMLPSNLANPGMLEREVERRNLAVLAQAIAPIILGAARAPKPLAEPPRQREPRRERAWIDIEVVDDSVPPRPLGAVRFHLRMPDGSTRDGAFDGEGQLHVDDVEPGRAWLEVKDVERLPPVSLSLRSIRCRARSPAVRPRLDCSAIRRTPAPGADKRGQ